VKLRLLNVVTALSLVLCVAVCVLWVRSQRVADTLTGTHLTVRSVFGGIVVAWAYGNDIHGYSSEWHGYREEDPADAWMGLEALFTQGERTKWKAAGMGYEHRVGTGGTTFLIFAPCWLLALVLGISPGAWVVRRLRRRHPPGLCPSCGYDLRASPERCPECGVVPG
jgi:hypothetical protein